MTLPGLQMSGPLFPLWEWSDRDCRSPLTCPCMARPIQTPNSLDIKPRRCCATQQLYHPIMASLPTGSHTQGSTGRKPLVRSNALILGLSLRPPSPLFRPVSPEHPEIWIKEEPMSPVMPPPTQPETPPQYAPVCPFPLGESPPPLTQKRKRGPDTLRPARLRPPLFEMMGYPLMPYQMRDAGLSDDPFGSLEVEVSYIVLMFNFKLTY